MINSIRRFEKNIKVGKKNSDKQNGNLYPSEIIIIWNIIRD